MKRNFLQRIRRAFAPVIAAVLALTLAACSTVEETGRRQFIAVPEGTEIQMGVEAYQQALQGARISQDPRHNELVQRVGTRIARAAEELDENLRKKGYQWELKVIDDDSTVNAWALPGGKVAVYTGILKVTRDEVGLATVLGHEVAHATKRHGGERITQALGVQLGGAALALALQDQDPETTTLVMSAFGIGSQVGYVLPFSRKQELEADQVGLRYMARAGYDPEKAIEFWQRMAEMSKGAKPPEFLSTHPDPENRIKRLRELVPRYKAEYRPAGSTPPPAITSPGRAPGAPGAAARPR